MRHSRRFILPVLVCTALLLTGSAWAGPFSCENRCLTNPLPPCALGCSDFGQASTCGNAGYACIDWYAAQASSSSATRFALASDVTLGGLPATPDAEPAAPEGEAAETLEGLRPEDAFTEVATCGPVPGCTFSHIEHSGGVSCCTYLCFGELEPIFCWEG